MQMYCEKEFRSEDEDPSDIFMLPSQNLEERRQNEERGGGKSYLREAVAAPTLGVLKARLVEQLGLLKGRWLERDIL